MAAHRQVADVARGAIGAALDAAVGDDPQADTVPDLDEEPGTSAHLAAASRRSPTHRPGPRRARPTGPDGRVPSRAGRARAARTAEPQGAIDPFDAAGYVALLRRLRSVTEDVVSAPEFRREIDEPIAGAVAVRGDVPLIVTEGNYLLIDEGEWSRCAACSTKSGT